MLLDVSTLRGYRAARMIAAAMEIQFTYECPRCRARGELSIDAVSRDEQGEGTEAARRDLRWLRPVLRCPGCGKRPWAGISRVVALVVVPPGGLLALFILGQLPHPTSYLVSSALYMIAASTAMRARIRRAGQVTTIRLAAPIPAARALTLPPS